MAKATHVARTTRVSNVGATNDRWIARGWLRRTSTGGRTARSMQPWLLRETKSRYSKLRLSRVGGEKSTSGEDDELHQLGVQESTELGASGLKACSLDFRHITQPRGSCAPPIGPKIAHVAFQWGAKIAAPRGDCFLTYSTFT